MTTQTSLNKIKRLIVMFVSMIYLMQFPSFVSPAAAQTTEEKNFLLMYFKEEELVVESSTRSPKDVSQVAENITVVTASDIKLMNAHTLADVLNTINGVQVFMTGGPGQIASGYIHGSVHMTVMLDGIAIFSTDIAGRLRQVEIGKDRLAFSTMGGGSLRVPGVDAAIRADYAGKALTPRATPEGITVDLPASAEAQRFEITWRAV